MNPFEEQNVQNSPVSFRVRCFLLFLGLFSWAHFILMASMGLDFGLDLLSAWNLGILISALGMILNPSRMIWAGAHAFFWIAFEFYKAPGGPNHLLLMTLTSLGMLVALSIRSVFGLSASRLGWDKTFRALIAFGRWQMIILYFFAVFHKLNTDFFDTSISCGVVMVLDILHHLPGLSRMESIPSPMGAVVFTLFMETLIPILLVIRATRFWGVLIGFWFHFVLSFHPNLYVMSFSWEVQAMYILFIPLDVLHQGRADWTKYAWSFGSSKGFWRFAVGMAALGLFGFCLWAGHSSIDQIFRRAFRSFFIIWVMLFSSYLLWNRYIRKTRPDQGSNPSQRDVSPWGPSWALLPVTLLTFLNGWTPYLGWKTNSNFSMFSNLRTETSVSNHLLIHKTRAGWTSRDQMVQILDATDPYLIHIRDLNQDGREWYVPEVLVRRRAHISDDDQFTVVVKNMEGDISFATRSDQARAAFETKGWTVNEKLLSGVSILERKFIDFRAIPLDGKPIPCLH